MDMDSTVRVGLAADGRIGLHLLTGGHEQAQIELDANQVTMLVAELLRAAVKASDGRGNSGRVLGKNVDAYVPTVYPSNLAVATIHDTVSPGIAFFFGDTTVLVELPQVSLVPLGESLHKFAAILGQGH